jgi:ATP-dependent exoDNAse (exonuclease V) beta subunit
MNSRSPYTIYSASAGAGKTSTLTIRYLSLILRDDRSLPFREILGLTFTNKAVDEMKKRILESLQSFSDATESNNYLFKSVLDEINSGSESPIEASTLRARSRKKLKELLHNYAYFDIATIDKFNHRLIRTFAKDLKLPSTFKVLLDRDDFLNQGLEKLFSKLSKDDALKKAMVSFAMEKIDDNKAWDISKELFDTATLLFDETHFKALGQLSTKTDEDFKKLKKVTKKKLEDIDDQLTKLSNNTLELLDELNLIDGFSGRYFPNFLRKVASGDRMMKLEAKWLTNFENQDPYNKSTPEAKKEAIDQIKPELNRVVNKIISLFKELAYIQNAYKNIQPLSLIFKVQQELNELMQEQQSLPIAEFNKRIYEVVRKQAVPFIYERIGERYKHFFVDEFQDTSVLQWENLIPLVSNALSSEEGSAMLVGDPKQAIYRWRGGAASQFIELYNNPKQPFPVEGDPINLETNYRSSKTVVNFNNDFFESTADLIVDEDLQQLYLTTSRQKVHHSDEEGWVSIEFVEGNKVEDRSVLYCQKTLEYIQKIIKRGFSYADICVLTRKNDQAVELAKHLTTNQIPIISSESLLLSSSAQVCFLIDLLYASNWPKEPYYQAIILEYLYRDSPDQSQNIKVALENFNQHLEEQFEFSMKYFSSCELFDALSYAIERFKLAEQSSAYINYFMDQVYEYLQTQNLGVAVFLELWEDHKTKWSVKSPKSVNAVQLMTVHKSKGLEFEFVILPFAEQELNPQKNSDVLWVDVDPNQFAGFDQLLFNKNKTLENFSSTTAELVQSEDRLKRMDSLNILYVALTRAIKGLVIISNWDFNSSDEFKEGTISHLLYSYLEKQSDWDQGMQYQIGSLEALELKSKPLLEGEELSFRYSHKKEASYSLLTHEKLLLDDATYKAKEAGTTWHRFLEFVYCEEDLNYAGVKLLEEYPFEEKEPYLIKGAEIVSHPDLKAYYKKEITSVNEQRIFTKDGLELRPDRLVFMDKEVVIIDYKTGEEREDHNQQLDLYAKALEELNYTISKKLIVYIHKEITIKNVT